jgi:hypothetical protein
MDDIALKSHCKRRVVRKNDSNGLKMPDWQDLNYPLTGLGGL